MRKKELKQVPKARNNAAHASLQSYFDRISHSLEDRVGEYVQMKKYVRVYEESQKLLDIEKALNIAAGSIYEINIERKLNMDSLKTLMLSLKEKNKTLVSLMQRKPQSLQLKLLSQISKNILLITNNLLRINKHITRINDLVPVVKALLKLQDREDNDVNDPILLEITNALTVNIDEPSLAGIKTVLEKEKIELNKFNAALKYEQMNDVSDKLIGLLNDKLLLVIGVSEFLIAGVEDDGANDIVAGQRMPDELRVLFLASSVFDIIYRVKEIRDGIKTIFGNIKVFLQIMNSDRLENQHKVFLKNGNDSVHDVLATNTPKILQRIKKAIIEVVPGLDAFALKLKLDTLDLDKVMKMIYGLIYEKANKVWENPYEI